MEQEASRLQGILLLAGELTERVVGAFEFVRKVAKGLLEHSLHSQAVLLAGPCWEREARDVAGSTHTRRFDVLGKQRRVLLRKDKLAEVEVFHSKVLKR